MWIRRLIPSDLSKIQPITGAFRTRILADQQPHRMALVAIKEGSDTLMDQARARAFALGNLANEFSSNTNQLVDNAIALTYALDLIKWNSEAEFEQYFEIARSIVESSHPDVAEPPLASNNNFWGNRCQIFRVLLAITALGRPGPSGAWAADALPRIANSLADDASYTHDPYMACNILSLAGIEGNEGFGKNFGGGNSIGAYTNYYAQMVPVIWSWDQAMGTDLFERCLFLKTLGHHNVPTEKTALRPFIKNECAYLFLASKETEAAWIWQRNPGWANFNQFCFYRGLMNSGTAPQPPTLKWREANNCFNWSDDPANPNALWASFTAPRMDCARFTNDAGQCEIGIGNVALLRELYERSFTNSTGGNGVHVSANPPPVPPQLMFERQGRSYWMNLLTKHRWTDPYQVTQEDGYRLYSPADLPFPTADPDGHYRWSISYGDQWRHSGQWGTTIEGRVQNEVTHSDWFPAGRVLVMEHEIACDLPLYLGYHFSPTHQTTPTADGFTFGDGVNLIRVTLEPLDGTTLVRTIRPSYGYQEIPKRVFENVGYAPTQRLPEHRCRVIVEVNP